MGIPLWEALQNEVPGRSHYLRPGQTGVGTNSVTEKAMEWSTSVSIFIAILSNMDQKKLMKLLEM